VRTLWNWLPDQIDARVRVFAWASLISQIVIIGTGGAVRLTGSGLGCPTWPQCTAESYVTTPEMGFHGVIEFANRLLTFVLVIIAISMFVMVVKQRRTRPELLRLSVALGLGIPGQAVIGGITVLTDLNPYVVGLHYLLSAVLVAVAAVLLYRVRVGVGGGATLVPPQVMSALWALLLFLFIAVLVGIVTTGSGPHAGDGGAARNGLNSELLQHIHAWPSYAVFGISVSVLVWLLTSGSTTALSRLRRTMVAGVSVVVVQIGVGLFQARNGLPEWAVGIHMVLASVIVALVVSAMLATKEEKPAPAPAGRSQRQETTV
jgi:cytochrome c oxidase assembly protein subunit 15